MSVRRPKICGNVNCPAFKKYTKKELATMRCEEEKRAARERLKIERYEKEKQMLSCKAYEIAEEYIKKCPKPDLPEELPLPTDEKQYPCVKDRQNLVNQEVDEALKEYDEKRNLEVYERIMTFLKNKEKRNRKKKNKCNPYITAYEDKMEEHLKRYQAAKKEYNNWRKDIVKEKKLAKKKLIMELKDRYGPDWYTELSYAQMEAADHLHTGLRDDREQATTHRCQRLLKTLGLHPPQSAARIQTVIEMSRANDMAFLWFLMELYYSDNAKPKEYSHNERIIMSCICHLDMITTLRELEKILPPVPVKEKTVVEKKVKKTTCNFFSPYLAPLPRPEMPNFKPLKMPVPMPNFTPYDRYKDPDYVVQNEANRWYAIKTCPVRRSTSGAKVVKGILRKVVDDVVDNNFDREKVMKALCAKHRKEKEDHDKMLCELTDQIKCCCKEAPINNNLIDKNAAKKEQMVHQIELEAAETKEEFERLAEKFYGQVIVKCIIQQLMNNAVDAKLAPCTNCTQCQEEYELYKKLINKYRCLCGTDEIVLDFGLDGVPKTKYFTRSMAHCPYSFNYEKIFMDDMFGDDYIGNSLKLALEIDKYANEDEAIAMCMKNMWQSEVKMWWEKWLDCEEKVAREEERILALEKKASILKKKSRPHKINPANDKQMEHLLRKAVLELRKNPKFVLASMPDVHRIPLLREWMKVRYKFKYTYEYRQQIVSNTVRLWHTMGNMKINVERPLASILLEKGIPLNYDNQKFYTKKALGLKNQYTKCLRLALLDKTREFWVTMMPYLCPMGPPRGPFYAYLPGRESDIHSFRPWKSGECKDMVYGTTGE